MNREEDLIVWCKKEQDFLCNEIERLESGRVRTFNLAGSAPTETTASTVVKLKAKPPACSCGFGLLIYRRLRNIGELSIGGFFLV